MGVVMVCLIQLFLTSKSAAGERPQPLPSNSAAAGKQQLPVQTIMAIELQAIP